MQRKKGKIKSVKQEWYKRDYLSICEGIGSEYN